MAPRQISSVKRMIVFLTKSDQNLSERLNYATLTQLYCRYNVTKGGEHTSFH